MRNERYRNEWKYLISPGKHLLLRPRLETAMQLDPHAKDGGYTIRSLYFDDFWNTAYEEKEDGVHLRKKYRIRIYNFSDRTIKLERKKKVGGYIYKEDAPLTRSQVEDIVQGRYDFLLASEHSLCREFYIECVCNGMRPRTSVDYEREPWIMELGTVRLTFDSEVRAAVGGCDIFDPSMTALQDAARADGGDGCGGLLPPERRGLHGAAARGQRRAGCDAGAVQRRIPWISGASSNGLRWARRFC